jgi:predicted glycoside hydrolase/deacetylase ChbG (UPF0249 family)
MTADRCFRRRLPFYFICSYNARMIRLIVNADDLGSSPPRDRGIFHAFAHGIVTSASLLATGASFRMAAHEVKALALPVGIHLNLSEGYALAGAIAGLTDAAGNFPGKTALRKILLAGAFDAAGVRRELLAQVACVRDAGITPDHLDTHQHCLLFPALTGIIAEVAATTGIRALRLPLPAESGGGNSCAGDSAVCPVGSATSAGSSAADGSQTEVLPEGVRCSVAGTPPPDRDGLQTLSAELILYRQLAPAARQLLHDRQLWTPDGLWGMPLLNRLDEATLAETLARIQPGTWELMTHPGRVNPAEPFGGPEREVELHALTAPAVRRLVADRGIELTTFGTCACGC